MSDSEGNDDEWEWLERELRSGDLSPRAHRKLLERLLELAPLHSVPPPDRERVALDCIVNLITRELPKEIIEFQAYLNVCLRHAVADYFRSQGEQLSIVIDEDGGEANHAAPEDTQPEHSDLIFHVLSEWIATSGDSYWLRHGILVALLDPTLRPPFRLANIRVGSADPKAVKAQVVVLYHDMGTALRADNPTSVDATDEPKRFTDYTEEQFLTHLLEQFVTLSERQIEALVPHGLACEGTSIQLKIMRRRKETKELRALRVVTIQAVAHNWTPHLGLGVVPSFVSDLTEEALNALYDSDVIVRLSYNRKMLEAKGRVTRVGWICTQPSSSPANTSLGYGLGIRLKKPLACDLSPIPLEFLKYSTKTPPPDHIGP